MKTRVEAVRNRLVKVNGFYWRQPQARGRIKRFLKREQKPQANEIEDIQRAYALFCPDRMRANRLDNERLAENLRQFIDRAMSSDPEYFQEQIAGVLDALKRIDK